MGRRFVPLLIVVVIGLLGTLGLGLLTSHYETESERESFNNEAYRTAGDFSNELKNILYILHTLQDFYHSSNEVNRGEFHRFTEDQKEFHPGIDGIYWFSEEALKGTSEETIFSNHVEGETTATLEVTDHIKSVRFGNSLTLLPMWELARRNNEAVKEKYEGQIFSLLPVEENDVDGSERTLTEGLIGQVFSLPKLKGGTLDRDWTELILRIPGDLSVSYYHITSDGVSYSTEEPSLDAEYSWSQTIPFYGQGLSIKAIPTEKFHRENDHWWTEIATLVCLLLTGFFAFIVQRIVDERKRITRKVDLRTRELEKAKQEAEEANRAKSDFLAKMSHELRTPLTTILGYQDLLSNAAEEEQLDESFGEDLDQIERSADHLLGLINEILDLSKIAAGKMSIKVEAFDVTEMVEEVAKTVKPLVEENNNELVVDVDDRLDTMHSDRTKIRQCLFNLLSNAAKFTEDGRIVMTAESNNSPDDPRIRFSVRDTGMGIKPEQQEALFDAFEQVEDSRTHDVEGTGLGLTITKKFTEMLGGTIELESEFGEGTTFVLDFPARISDPEPDEPEESKDEQPAEEPQPDHRDEQPAENGAPQNGNPVLLAIDDEEEATELVRRFLEPEGYHIEEARGGMDGFQKAIDLEPDVITLDVMMPEVDGWEVLSGLKEDERTADIPVVLISVSDEEEMGASLGADEFLMKPVDRDRLLQVIGNYIDDGSVGSLMVVEDNPDTRDQLERALSDGGGTLYQAVNGLDALDKLEDGVHPDLILLDLMMPVMDGTEFLRHLRHGTDHDIPDELRDVPVIILTNKQLTDGEKNQLEELVQDIWKKGDDPLEAIAEKIEKQVSQTA